MTKRTILANRRNGYPLYLHRKMLTDGHWMLWPEFPGLDGLISWATQRALVDDAPSPVVRRAMQNYRKRSGSLAKNDVVLALPPELAMGTAIRKGFTPLVPGVLRVDVSYLLTADRLKLRLFWPNGETDSQVPMKLVSPGDKVVGLLMGARP